LRESQQHPSVKLLRFSLWRRIDSGEYRYVRGKLQRNREGSTVLGLNDNHNKDLKSLFKSAAIAFPNRSAVIDE
jgi:hypothetical protein